jgi:hypothetical protein
MTKIDRLIANHLTSCLDDHLIDGTVFSSIFTVDGQQYAVEYLGNPPRVQLFQYDEDSDEFVVKRRFTVELKVTEVT